MEDQATQSLLTAELQALTGSRSILRVTGEIDISSVHVLNEQFRTAADAGCSELIIDATDVTFMDSTGLHALIEGKRLIHQNGSQIVLVPSRQVRRVMELVFPEPLFARRVDTVEEALQLLES
jgi:anti-sigma B factor antagonist